MRTRNGRSREVNASDLFMKRPPSKERWTSPPGGRMALSPDEG